MKNLHKKISNDLLNQYKSFIESYGGSAKGIGWNNDYTCKLRYNRMLKVIDDFYYNHNISLLDVGCGFGGLLDYSIDKKVDVDYFGIDINPKAIEIGVSNHNSHKFILGDFLDIKFERKFDYVVCNGILTFKNEATQFEMESYTKSIIKKMFELCEIGIAFNLLTTHVDNFAPLNFYTNPLEFFVYCMQNISSDIKIDHSYRLREYTIYLYKNCEERLNLYC